MTVSTTTNKTQPLGDGSTTVFSYPFKIFAATDLRVSVTTIGTGVTVTRTLSTDYTVTGAGNANGGTVVFGTAPASGTRITIERVLPLKQTVDLRNAGAFFAETHEDVFDRLVMADQQQQGTLDRAITAPATDVSPQLTLPGAATRANKLLSFDENGNVQAVAAASQSATELETRLQDGEGAQIVGFGNPYVFSSYKTVGEALKQLFSASSQVQDFRLSLSDTSAVPTSDITAASTIYLLPYRGSRMAVWDSTSAVWRVLLSNSYWQSSLALTGLISGRPYDVFAYLDYVIFPEIDPIPVIKMATVAWSNDTTRATALVYKDGVLVQSGNPSRRYLGTFYTTGTNTTEDSVTKRYVWNYYNRVDSHMQRVDPTASWTYTTATWRQANGNTQNQLDYVVGVAEDAFQFSVTGASQNGSTGVSRLVAIGNDSTSSPTGTRTMTEATNYTPLVAQARFIPSAGRHYAAWLEYSVASGTTTWLGFVATSPNYQSGLLGTGKR